MIALLLFSLASAQEGAPPEPDPADDLGALADDLAVLAEIDPLAAEPDAIVIVGDGAPGEGLPWAIIMNALIGLGLFVGGAARMLRGAPASEVKRITDPRMDQIVATLDRTFSTIGVVKGAAMELTAAHDRRLVALDPLLLERIDRLLAEQARTNDLMAGALERLPDLLED